MRFVVVDSISLRGEGLGNEAIGWAKGFLASEILGAKLVGPAWGFNRRRYWRNFRSSRLDVFRSLALRGLSRRHFTEHDYRASGRVDFGEAVQVWADKQGIGPRDNFILTLGGMYGGYRCIRRGANFLRSQLLSSRDALSNMERVSRAIDRAKLWVSVHVRLGDFQPNAAVDARGQFNFRLPVEWYISACRAVREQYGKNAQFTFFTDQQTTEFLDLAREFQAIPVETSALSECSDLLLMAESDLRVCSVSSYSLLACFLSDGPYLWYEPQLKCSGATYSIWGEQDQHLEIHGQAVKSRDHVDDLMSSNPGSLDALGFAHSIGSSLPQRLVVQLSRRVQLRDPRTNLIEFGSIPIAWSESTD